MKSEKQKPKIKTTRYKNMKLSEKYVLGLVRDYLRVFIEPEIKSRHEAGSPGRMFTLNDISALAYRETFSKLIPLLRKGKTINEVYREFTGDNGHGHSPFQIDDRWHPGFIRSGDWMDMRKATSKCFDVLEEAVRVLKRYKERKNFKRMVFSAYNCGAGRVKNAVSKGKSPDYYTHERNYGAEVMRLSGKLDLIKDDRGAESIDEPDVIISSDKEAKKAGREN